MSSIPAVAAPTLDAFMEEIADTTLGSAAASISFASIDSKYKLFRVTAYLIDEAPTNQNVQMRLNNDSGANYDYQTIYGSSTTVAAARTTGASYAVLTASPILSGEAGMFSVVIAKQVVGSAAMIISEVATGGTVTRQSIAARWNNTADLISRIDLIAASGNFAAGTTATLDGDGST